MQNNFLLVVVLLLLAFVLPFLIFLMRNLRSILPYLYAIARVRAKEARLLKPESIEEMVNTGSVAEIASMLENTEYGAAMQGLVLDSAAAIEELLTLQAADVYSEISRMLPDRVAPVFSYLRQQWDVRNLKTIIRGVRAGAPAETIAARLISFGELDPDLLRKMTEAASIEDLLPLFEGTRYEQLAGMYTAYEQDTSLLPLEAALDRMLLEEMWHTVSADRELADLQPGFAARIDALNMNILLRAKRDHLTLGDVEPYLVTGGSLPPGVLSAFDEVDDAAGLIAELEGTSLYKPLMDALSVSEQTGSGAIFEKTLQEHALAVGRQTAVKQPYGIAPILGYLALKETEIRNIRAISRAKETGMQPETIRELVLQV